MWGRRKFFYVIGRDADLIERESISKMALDSQFFANYRSSYKKREIINCCEYKFKLFSNQLNKFTEIINNGGEYAE